MFVRYYYLPKHVRPIHLELIHIRFLYRLLDRLQEEQFAQVLTRAGVKAKTKAKGKGKGKAKAADAEHEEGAGVVHVVRWLQ